MIKNYLLRCASADDESARVRNYKSIAKPRVCKFACSAELNDEVDSVALNANRCSPCHSFLLAIRFFLLVSGVRGPLKISLFITATNERLAEAVNKRNADECRQTCIALGLRAGTTRVQIEVDEKSFAAAFKYLRRFLSPSDASLRSVIRHKINRLAHHLVCQRGTAASASVLASSQSTEPSVRNATNSHFSGSLRRLRCAP